MRCSSLSCNRCSPRARCSRSSSPSRQWLLACSLAARLTNNRAPTWTWRPPCPWSACPRCSKGSAPAPSYRLPWCSSRSRTRIPSWCSRKCSRCNSSSNRHLCSSSRSSRSRSSRSSNSSPWVTKSRIRSNSGFSLSLKSLKVVEFFQPSFGPWKYLTNDLSPWILKLQS